MSAAPHRSAIRRTASLRTATRRTASWAAGAAALALVLTGCSGSGLGDTSNGNNQGYISNNGEVTTVALEDRGDPVELSGAATDGAEVDVADWRGDVVVLNVWYAACPPCRAEAPDLVASVEANPDVHYLGINTEDGEATAQAFEESFSVPYPSVLDAGSGEAVLALRGSVPPRAVPSTVVLDREGRPSAVVLGRVQPDILQGLIDDAVAEGGGGAA